MLSNNSEDITVEEKWGIIKDTIIALLNKKKHDHSFQEIYFSVFYICQKEKVAMLYERIEVILSNHVESIRDRLLKVPEQIFFDHLKDEWDKYCQSLEDIDRILLYVKKNFGTYRLIVPMTGDSLFNCIVLQNDVLLKTFKKCVKLSLSSGLHSMNTLKNLSFKVYKHYKETLYEPCIALPIADALVEKYESEMEHRLRNSDVVSYLLWALDVLEKAKADVRDVMVEGTAQQIERNMGKYLITRHINWLLYTDTMGGVSMVKNMDTESLRYLAQALEKVDETKSLLDMVASTFKEMESKLLTDTQETDPVRVVEKILSSKTRMENLISTLPGVEMNVASTVAKALTEVVNERPELAEKLAYYFYAKLKTGPSEEALNQIITDTLFLLGLFESRTAFEQVFKVLLAARLLSSELDNSVIPEVGLIEKLWGLCGNSVVEAYKRMIKDIGTEKEIAESFLSCSLVMGRVLPIDFNVKVITNTVWPHFANIELCPPESMKECMHLFELYFTKSHNCKTLSFNLNLGTVFLTLNHGKVYEVSAPTAFISTILCFQNDNDIMWLTLQDVCSATELSEDIVLYQLKRLARAKLITIDTTNGDSRFTFNHGFEHPKEKLYIRESIGSRHIEDTVEPQSQKLLRQGLHTESIQALIYKIMKEKKTMQHGEICLYVTDLLKKKGVMPTILDIKNNLEKLINKDLISRGSFPNVYVYKV